MSQREIVLEIPGHETMSAFGAFPAGSLDFLLWTSNFLSARFKQHLTHMDNAQ